jgi:hypothetical protein
MREIYREIESERERERGQEVEKFVKHNGG